MDTNFQKGFFNNYIEQVLSIFQKLLDDKSLVVKVNTSTRMPTEGFKIDWNLFISCFGNQILSSIQNAAKETEIVVTIAFEETEGSS